jgi:putative SOS response-associated peptidase YedK
MTQNAPGLAHSHVRSPLILTPDQWQSRLTARLDDLNRFDRPFSAEAMRVEATTEPWARR